MPQIDMARIALEMTENRKVESLLNIAMAIDLKSDFEQKQLAWYAVISSTRSASQLPSPTTDENVLSFIDAVVHFAIIPMLTEAVDHGYHQKEDRGGTIPDRPQRLRNLHAFPSNVAKTTETRSGRRYAQITTPSDALTGHNCRRE